MKTPFNKVIKHIKRIGYHNHRRETHSNIVSDEIFRDLLTHCEQLKKDYEKGLIKKWEKKKAPGNRGRRIDLLIGKPDVEGEPDLEKVRLALENKSVITAHRNKSARFDDLTEELKAIQNKRQDAIIVATIMVGLAEKVLNVPDQVKKRYKGKEDEFQNKILPRLSTGDNSLWEEFDWAISENKPDDPQKTVKRFRELPLRNPALTHEYGYDYVLIVPVHIDNVNPPSLPKEALGIKIKEDYKEMMDVICKAYKARWHLSTF